jgi:hypothetical protein
VVYRPLTGTLGAGDKVVITQVGRATVWPKRMSAGRIPDNGFVASHQITIAASVQRVRLLVIKL